MHSIDTDVLHEVRKKLLSCICVSHGIVVNRDVFMDELEHTLSRVFACFFEDIGIEQQKLVYESLKLEFCSLSGSQLKQLVVQENGYFLSIIWPRIVDYICWTLLIVAMPLKLIAAALEIKWIRRVLATLFFPLTWFIETWISMFEGVAKMFLPKRFFDDNIITYHYVSWVPTPPDGEPSEIR